MAVSKTISRFSPCFNEQFFSPAFQPHEAWSNKLYKHLLVQPANGPPSLFAAQHRNDFQ